MKFLRSNVIQVDGVTWQRAIQVGKCNCPNDAAHSTRFLRSEHHPQSAEFYCESCSISLVGPDAK